MMKVNSYIIRWLGSKCIYTWQMKFPSNSGGEREKKKEILLAVWLLNLSNQILHTASEFYLEPFNVLQSLRG